MLELIVKLITDVAFLISRTPVESNRAKSNADAPYAYADTATFTVLENYTYQRKWIICKFEKLSIDRSCS